ncbi:MAG TPA: circularly permuted type 2 ATP-grasp protein, partial [Planctomycetota bacterium]|nr:circularly permuted type 2 ATP-grasp protein [Planctomycetota bacterium]
MILDGYTPIPGCFDEMVDAGGAPRPEFARAVELLARMSADDFARSQALAELALLNQGVTFSVYKDARGTEKIFPFCLIPRMISAADWRKIERGLEQRLRALGLFLDDVYGDGRILDEGVVPRELVLGAAGFIPALKGLKPPGGVRVH